MEEEGDGEDVCLVFACMFFPGMGAGPGFSLCWRPFGPRPTPCATQRGHFLSRKIAFFNLEGQKRLEISTKILAGYLFTPISREKAWVGWLGRVFLEKKLGLNGWGAYFSRKSLGWITGTRLSREKAWVGWLGRVFLEKKLGLDGWGAYFSRKSLGWMAGACISREKAWVEWLGRVFLEEKFGLDNLDA